jgi:hypothetical protein
MSLHPDILTLRSPHTVRARAHALLALGIAGELRHFEVHTSALDAAAKGIAELTRKRFPDLRVPTHGRMLHFDADGVARSKAMRGRLAHLPALARARALVDVVTVSVLLDAGAGMAWRYTEPHTGAVLSRSEGLAVASLHWLEAGGLSSHGAPFEVDTVGLAALSEDALCRAFQVTAHNPLVGVAGRVHLLRELGHLLRVRADVFGKEARIGGLVDSFARSHPDGKVPAEAVLALLLDALAPIWPGRLSLHGMPLGDVFAHAQVDGPGETRGLVPFHKLSQWLSYSLFEPLQEAGLHITHSDTLTGLAEYRNGGMLLDLGVLVPKDPALPSAKHAADAEAIVEWRALTVALLDALLPKVRAELHQPDLPLASMLEGGSWGLGRELARARRADGGPPLHIASDGTLF